MKALLIHSSGKKLFLDLSKDEIHTEFGIISASDIKKAFGKKVKSHKGEEFTVLKLSILEEVENMKMFSRPIYPYDSSIMCAMLDIGQGSKVLEAGTGSGGNTLYMVKLGADIVTYEREEKAHKKAKRNLEEIKSVSLHLGEPWDDKGEYDAIFLDLQDPSGAIQKLDKNLKIGGWIGVYTPIIDDIKPVWLTMKELEYGFPRAIQLDMNEIIVKKYARVKGLLGFPGFFIWARKVK